MALGVVVVSILPFASGCGSGGRRANPLGSSTLDAAAIAPGGRPETSGAGGLPLCLEADVTATPANFKAGEGPGRVFPPIVEVWAVSRVACRGAGIASFEASDMENQRLFRTHEGVVLGLERTLLAIEVPVGAKLAQVDVFIGEAPVDARFSPGYHIKNWFGVPRLDTSASPADGQPNTTPAPPPPPAPTPCPVDLRIQGGEARPNPDGHTAKGSAKVWWADAPGAPQRVTVTASTQAGVHGTVTASNGDVVSWDFEMLRDQPYDVRVEATDESCAGAGNRARAAITVPALQCPHDHM
jgi:hypothetical protein